MNLECELAAPLSLRRIWCVATILRPFTFRLLVSALGLLSALLVAMVLSMPAYVTLPLTALAFFVTGLFTTRYFLELAQELI